LGKIQQIVATFFTLQLYAISHITDGLQQELLMLLIYEFVRYPKLSTRFNSPGTAQKLDKWC